MKTDKLTRNECFECKSKNITKDYNRIETYCSKCGLVLISQNKDYYPDEYSKLSITSKEHKIIVLGSEGKK